MSMDSKLFEMSKEFLLQLLGVDNFDLKFYLMLAVGVVAGVTVLAKLAAVFSGGSVGAPRATIALVLGGVLLLLASALSEVYLAPRAGGFAKWVPLAVAVAGMFVIVIPLTCKICSVNYLVAMGACWIAVLAMVLLMFVTAYVYGMVQGGKSVGQRGRGHQKANERALSF